MTSAAHATIVPITLTVNGRIGLTLYAPPWEDEDGEEWQGFLGDGAKILMFPNTRELADFIAKGEENDLSDHPAWGQIIRATPDQLRPLPGDAYDLDAVYEWAAGEPDPVSVSSLANVVDMVERIADCCDDGALRRLVGSTPEYEELVSEDVSYQGREGRRSWSQLGDVIAESWERALTRVAQWLSWRGDFSATDLEAETVWDRIGAEPIEIVLPEATYFTLRAVQDERVLFLGSDGTVVVFSDTADLASYCRTAEEHDLTRLQWWQEVSEADDSAFQPGLNSIYDLGSPSTRGAELLRDLAAFCELDVAALGIEADPVPEETWEEARAEVVTCFELQD